MNWKTVSIVVCVCIAITAAHTYSAAVLLHTKQIGNHKANTFFVYLFNFIMKYAHMHYALPSFAYLVVFFFPFSFTLNLVCSIDTRKEKQKKYKKKNSHIIDYLLFVFFYLSSKLLKIKIEIGIQKDKCSPH